MVEPQKVEIFRQYLEAYLNIFWLRPGTAVWRAYDAMVLHDLDWSLRPSLDLCCGDGINSFIFFGGKFGIGFDAFLAVRNLTVEEFLVGRKDMYDYPFNPSQKIDIQSYPKRKFDFGIDWKISLLEKAKKLRLYDKLIHADVNTGLCLDDKSIGLIFSNAIYWMADVRKCLTELRRILKDNGKIIALLPTPVLKKHYIYEKYLKYGWRFCKILDMGRYDCIKHLYTCRLWQRVFEDCGLKVRSSESYLSGRFIEISEIEIRPLSNVMSKIVNSLSPKERAENKRKWIDTLMYLIMPMFKEGFLSDEGGDQTFLRFELIKE